MGGVVIVLIIKIEIFLITKDMISMGNFSVPIRIFIKELESAQTSQPGSFTKATWNTAGCYILVETTNMPSGMGRKPVSCFCYCQFGHYASECPNPDFSEDYAPICGNCKQSGHTTNQCNAPFNYNNHNQQMQTSDSIEDKTRALPSSPVNCIEVIRVVQTQGQRTIKINRFNKRN